MPGLRLRRFRGKADIDQQTIPAELVENDPQRDIHCRVSGFREGPRFSFKAIRNKCALLNISPRGRQIRERLRKGKLLPEAPLVLVVEDQYLLLFDLEQALAEGGFAAECAFSGEEALALFVSGGKNYVALVTDVNLGRGLNGWEVARRIREKEPSFPIIYMTAYAEDWALQGVPNSVLVPKPYAPAQLVGALSNLLYIGTIPTK